MTEIENRKTAAQLAFEGYNEGKKGATWDKLSDEARARWDAAAAPVSIAAAKLVLEQHREHVERIEAELAAARAAPASTAAVTVEVGDAAEVRAQLEAARVAIEGLGADVRRLEGERDAARAEADLEAQGAAFAIVRAGTKRLAWWNGAAWVSDVDAALWFARFDDADGYRALYLGDGGGSIVARSVAPVASEGGPS